MESHVNVLGPDRIERITGLVDRKEVVVRDSTEPAC